MQCCLLSKEPTSTVERHATCQSILAIKKGACLTYIGFAFWMRPGLDMHGAALSFAMSLHLSERLQADIRGHRFLRTNFPRWQPRNGVPSASSSALQAFQCTCDTEQQYHATKEQTEVPSIVSCGIGKHSKREVAARARIHAQQSVRQPTCPSAHSARAATKGTLVATSSITMLFV